MCGIAGFLDDDPRARRSESELVAMGEALRHRGPDAHGSTLAHGVGLHNRRLAILDLSPDGNQPMFSRDGSVAIVFNGEIYNFRELRRELEARGHVFRSQSDTEVVVYLFEEHRDAPERMLARLNGFFALAVHDRRNGRLLLARDRLGVKPLYYARTARGLVFGSELKALLAEGGLRRDLDPTALLDYLALRYVPAPKTIWRDAKKLPAGHFLLVEAGAGTNGRPLEPRSWWDLPQFATRRDPPERLAEELWATIEDSVRLRLVSDVPLGAFLSGGVDSSAVVAAMAGLARRSGGAGSVTAVTVGFRDWEHSEVDHARTVARALGVNHVVAELEPAAIDLVEPLAEFFDEPFADPSAIPTWLLARSAREHVTVALSGDGGDECFAGYRRYRFEAAEHRVRALLPGALFRGLFRGAGALWPASARLPRPLRAKTTLQNLGRAPLDAYVRSVSSMDLAEARALLHPDLRAATAGYDPVESFRPWWERAPASDPLSRAQYVDFHTWLPEYVLTKSDRATMAASLEAREPLLDYRLVELAAAIPPGWKVHDGVGKWILRRAIAPHLPAETAARRKQGFAPPLERWVRRELDAKGDRFPAPRSVDPAALAAAVARHRSGRRDHSELLYSMLVLSAFEKRWLGA